MISVLLLIRSLEIGGAERQLCVLAQQLHEKGYSAKVVVFYENGPLESDLLNYGVPVIGLKRRGRLDIFSFFFRLLHLIQREKPDVLHSYLPVANIWAAFVKIFSPRTSVVWGVRASNIDLKQYGWQVQLTDYIEALLSRIPDWIICNSQSGLLHAVKKGFPKERMSVISNGIDTSRFFHDRKQGQRLRQLWNIQEHQKLIGIVARLDPIKGYTNFLRASALLIRSKDNVRFVCVGDGSQDLLKEYKELAFSLGLENALIWADRQDDMLGVYNALDIIVSASIGEGFSNVIGEAMACGVPCVVTDVGDSALLVGDFGVVVPHSNPEALRVGVLNLLQLVSKQELFIQNQLSQRAVQKFSVDALASNTVQLFERLMISN